MYQMRKDPTIRHLSDIVSYGNGLRLFRSPGEAITTPDNTLPSNSNLYSNAYGSLYGTLYRVRVWVKADKYVNNDYEFPCNDPSTGETVAYYPPETNKRMRQHSSSGGYKNTQKKCASGPAVIYYACSGVPVLSSDIREAFLDGGLNQTVINDLNEVYYGTVNDGIQPVTQAWTECNVYPRFEQLLGETGKFVAKDWRKDQIQKHSALEGSFKQISLEALAGEEIVNGDPDYDAVVKYSQGVALPDSITGHLIYKEEEDEDGDIIVTDNELLPVQKSGQEFLNFLIHKARPKQHGKDEAGNELITEMPYYQASEFDGSNFEIDFYDPWHPVNAGEDWPTLGKTRSESFPITYNNPDGLGGAFDVGGSGAEFEFRYPIRDAYVNAYPGQDFENDANWRAIVPEWEENLFKAWYKNNPIYIHAVPGGWSWSGFGNRHGIREVQRYTTLQGTEQCRWATQSYQLGKLDSIHQLAGPAYAPPGIFLIEGEIPPGCPNGDIQTCVAQKFYEQCDAFPNFVWSYNSFGGLHYWNQSGQLRNKNPFSRCRTLPQKCAPPGCVQYCPEPKICFPQPGNCYCEAGYRQGPANGNWNSCGVDECAGTPTGPGGIFRNCCNVYGSSYSGRKAEGREYLGKATAAILENNPTSVSTKSSKEEIQNWSNMNPSTPMYDSSFYGIRCSESGGCPFGYKCCCPAGCDGDCFCIPEGNECETPPCSSQYDFDTPCCQNFGSCCYVENGKLKCIDNVSEEQCIAAKSIGGFDGTFNKNAECRSGLCSTTTVRGACFYNDKLRQHQVCRDTTEETCTLLGGEFHAKKDCSEFTDKETTGYESITQQVGAKPPFAGDRSCGGYGFSVNCCTEEIDESTGEVTHTCEVKCISDCDVRSGRSRIVSTCESCGELGSCCTKDGYCKPNVTRADCFGTFFPGGECNETSCIHPERYTFAPDPDITYNTRSEFRGGDPDVIIDPPTDEELDNCVTCKDLDGNGQIGINYQTCLGGIGAGFPLSSRYAPKNGTLYGISGAYGCGVSAHALTSLNCVVRNVQVTKIGFRHIAMLSLRDASAMGEDTVCPCMGQCNPANQSYNCCDYKCNPTYFKDNSKCQFDPSEQLRGLHDAIDTLEVTVYPYKVRCQQVRDSQGFWGCGALQEYLSPNQTSDFAIGIASLADFLVCHRLKLSTSNCQINEGTDNCESTQPQQCDDGNIEGGAPDQVETKLADAANCTQIFETQHYNKSNRGGLCPAIGSGYTAFSIEFPTGGYDHLYAPRYGVSNIPASHCFGGGAERPLNSPPKQPPPGILSDCAEFYNDKLLVDVNQYDPPPPYEELIFHDYGGLTGGDISHWLCQSDLEDSNANWFAGASAEYVDAFFNDAKNPNEFWIKKQFPDLEYVRLFGVGCYNIPGSFEGGRGHTLEIDGVTYPAGGDFAGTMVLTFGTTTEFQRFDEIYGAENLKLTFESVVPNQPDNEPIGGGNNRWSFVAQPSHNINKDAFADFNGSCSDTPRGPDEDCPKEFPQQGGEDAGPRCAYSNVGFLNGRGLTYSNVENGLTGEYNGKVYEFCSFLGINDDSVLDNELGGQLKPIFRLPADQIPIFSGVRGPLVLNARNEEGESLYDMTVTLKRFDVVEDNECGFCYTESGNLYGTNGSVARPTKAGCLEPNPDGSPGNSNIYFPGISGITTGGALGCCTHEPGDPLGMAGPEDLDGTPCNSWQERGATEHNNPARTFGDGDCACNEGEDG